MSYASSAPKKHPLLKREREKSEAGRRPACRPRRSEGTCAKFAVGEAWRRGEQSRGRGIFWGAEGHRSNMNFGLKLHLGSQQKLLYSLSKATPRCHTLRLQPSLRTEDVDPYSVPAKGPAQDLICVFFPLCRQRRGAWRSIQSRAPRTSTIFQPTVSAPSPATIGSSKFNTCFGNAGWSTAGRHGTNAQVASDLLQVASRMWLRSGRAGMLRTRHRGLL